MTQFDSLSDCHTLFITKHDLNKWYYLVKKVPMKSIMLVGEFDDFILTGGHINFFIVGGKIRFEVHPDRLKQSGINISSKVLPQNTYIWHSMAQAILHHQDVNISDKAINY